jgi:hypothetical protein
MGLSAKQIALRACRGQTRIAHPGGIEIRTSCPLAVTAQVEIEAPADGEALQITGQPYPARGATALQRSI